MRERISLIEQQETLEVGKIEGLFRYPLKSGKAEELEEMYIDLSGPRGDRNWAIRKPDGTFVSQRDKEGQRLALVKATLNNDGNLVLEAPGMEPLIVPKTEVGAETDIQIWKANVTVLDQGNAAAEWLKKFLGLEGDYRLVQRSEEHPRQISQSWVDNPDGTVTLADGYPVLLTSVSSLESLNEHLDNPVPIDRFRANIVISGFEPWAEDRWEVIQIGEVVFDVVKPCDRCAVPSVDQATGERKEKSEPLKTLVRIRGEQQLAESAGTDKFIEVKGGFFGWNLVPLNSGKITKDDKVIVLKRRQKPA